MEYTHTHPVLLLFCRLLLQGSRHRRAAANDDDVFVDLGEVGKSSTDPPHLAS